MLLTKHCRPEDRERMLDGHFKIGSHREYSKGELTGTLSDTAEGSGGFIVKGALTNFSGKVGTNTFTNCNFGAAMSGNSFVYEDAVNTLMFCASLGSYNVQRHEAIIRGDLDRSYPPNAGLTAYLTLDSDRLKAALTAATDELFGVSTRWIAGPVSYGSRHEIFNAQMFRGASSQELMIRLANQASIKPERFAIEEEFRFLMVLLPQAQLPEALLTKELSESIHNAFKLTIVDAGGVQTRAT